ncbi:MAG TPA: cytochrome c oxidase subunit 4 [Propionibacteriaceae bacterium]|nr:cytochrome c oxidase subunit 4 [Propionibacteriaceae bacterium]
MKAERAVFIFLTVYFAAIAPIYWFSTREIVGAVALLLTFVFCLMIAGYLFVMGVKIDSRPEDDADGEIYQGAGELGFFPPKSIWPFWAALTLAVIVLGPVFGWWISLLGIGMGIWSASGWVFEFYRGDYAH